MNDLNIFNDASSIIVCDAVVAYHSHRNVREAVMHSQIKAHSITSESVEFWLFLVQCYLGNLKLVREAHQTLEERSCAVELSGRVSSCIHVAAREGHEGIVHYLLDAGANLQSRALRDVEKERWQCCYRFEQAHASIPADNLQTHS